MIEYVGIRHHGPGSAARVRQTLEKIQPDIILLEAPEEANGELLLWIQKLQTPVSMLFYQEGSEKSVIYPFAEYSPEWQAMLWASQKGKKIHCIDMSVAMQWHYEQLQEQKHQQKYEQIQQLVETLQLQGKSPEEIEAHMAQIYKQETEEDDLQAWLYYANANSFDEFLDHHSESHFEDVSQLFEEAITHMRGDTHEFDAYREAIMRTHIRNVQKQNLKAKIVVVCGAWHVPALRKMEDKNQEKELQKQDAELIKSLGKTKFEAKGQWIPWNNERLTMFSGYGAGIQSPVLYEKIWQAIQKKQIQNVAVDFFAHASQVLRKKDIDIPPASVIEATYLANHLCQFRNRATPSIQDIEDAIETIWLMGDDSLLTQYGKEIFIGNSTGKVPDEYPVSALEQDFKTQFKKLFGRIYKSLEALQDNPSELELDLREENDQKKHVFLYQVEFLGIPFARHGYQSGSGIHKRTWHLEWSVESEIAIKQCAYLGSTIQQACLSILYQKIKAATSVGELAQLLNHAIEMNITKVLPQLILQIDTVCTQPVDIQDLLALLSDDDIILKYTNADTFTAYQPLKNLEKILKITLERGLARLPLQCINLAPDAAEAINKLIQKVTNNLSLLQDKIPDWQPYFEKWKQTLKYILHQNNTSAIIQGSLLRQFIDWGMFQEFNPDVPEKYIDEVQKALSQANDISFMIQWLQGLLQGTPGRLLYIPELWKTLSDWIDTLPEEHFTTLLPLFRKAIQHYSPMERREIKAMGVQKTSSQTQQGSNSLTDFSAEKANEYLSLIDFWVK